MEHDDIPTGDGLETQACPDCDGSGFNDEDGSPCDNCGGVGYVEAGSVRNAGEHPCREVDAATCYDLSDCASGCIRVHGRGERVVCSDEPNEGEK